MTWLRHPLAWARLKISVAHTIASIFRWKPGKIGYLRSAVGYVREFCVCLLLPVGVTADEYTNSKGADRAPWER